MKKYMLNTILIMILSAVGLLVSGCKKKQTGGGSTPPPVINYDVPPSTWQEHWFDHAQLVSRVYYDTSLVVYFDNDVQKSITWPNTFVKEVWQYTRKTYGYEFGSDKRLYAIFHAGKYSGGHPGYYYSSRHDNRNVIDCGSSSLNAWTAGTGNDLDLVTHEVGHVVESANNNAKGSPAFAIWKDSKWMEIYIYDVYKGLGRTADADRWYNLMMGTTDNFPQTNTQWFKNWFYPIYNQYGGSAVLNKFFKLLAANFPKDGNRQYTRDLNWGEFIHFWSGAAGANLKPLATTAFGWPAEWETQFNKAKTDFPSVTY
ncbi:hypothetical protein [Lacibacter luteus]|nr:hypothetical protein [Lacibacter luteus]